MPLDFSFFYSHDTFCLKLLTCFVSLDTVGVYGCEWAVLADPMSELSPTSWLFLQAKFMGATALGACVHSLTYCLSVLNGACQIRNLWTSIVVSILYNLLFLATLTKFDQQGSLWMPFKVTLVLVIKIPQFLFRCANFKSIWYNGSM